MAMTEYLIVPQWHSDTGPIALGNIIADPLQPHQALTTVDANILKTTYKMNTKHGGNGSNRSETHVTSSYELKYTMDTLETRFFIHDPPLKEIKARVNVPRVQDVIKGGRQPVYMVTGLEIATDFHLWEKRKHGGKIVINSWKAHGDMVFAYRLHKIEVKGTTIEFNIVMNENKFLSIDKST
ncbi:aldehyde dehydrogenase, conserved site [Elaphomyces granulatus]